MISIFDKIGRDALDEYLQLAARYKVIDQDAARALALSTIRYYKGNGDERLAQRSQQELECRWYRSLEAGAPDYTVYDHDYFVSDIWACWIVYSRKSLLMLRKFLSRLDGVRRVADLGCGIGYTTAGLVEMFPGSEVYGTQLENTFQYQLTAAVGVERGFRVCPVVESNTDLIFASEYFEHFERPIEHLHDVIISANPRYLVLVNSFAPTSIGHFNYYKNLDVIVSNLNMGRVFNSALRAAGYTKCVTGFWNNRPAVWERTV